MIKCYEEQLMTMATSIAPRAISSSAPPAISTSSSSASTRSTTPIHYFDINNNIDDLVIK